MTSDVYTLPELVDVALKTPEIGAVNFNALRIVLLKIVTECKLQNVTAEWKPTPVSTIVKFSEDTNIPVHPIYLRIANEKQKREAEKISLKKKSKVSPDDETKEEAFVGGGEEKISGEVSETEIGKYEKQKHLGKANDETLSVPEEEKAVQITTEKVKSDAVIHPDETTPVTTDMESSTETEISEGEEKRMKSKTIRRKKKPPDGADTSLKGVNAESNLWHLWQVKKLMKRVEGLEEELTSLVKIVDELEELKSLRGKRILFEEGERMESGYSGPVVDREEFEHTIEELGEALARVSLKLKQHNEESSTKNQDIWKEMSLKASVEDLNRCKEPLSIKLKTLGVAVKNIQRVIKEIIYPDSCGITKCMACRRKAHLPYRPQIIDKKEEISKKEKEPQETCNVIEHTECEPSSTLKFTKRILRRSRITENANDKSLADEKSFKGLQPKFSEVSVDPSHIINVETFDLMNMSKSFEPLRRNSIFIPVSRPKTSVTITVEKMN